jgi:NhaP-type Na+/H+ or K+/H+ antiporter
LALCSGFSSPRGGETPRRLLEEVARLTLAVGLMRVALRLPRGYPAKAWRSLAVLLTLGMLAMWLCASAMAHALLGLPWWESLLMGAILTPTDPVVAASLTTGEVAETNLPADTRHLLSAESGANDGLAYPFVVLPVLVLTRPAGEVLPHFLTQTLLHEVGGAVALGLFLGWGLGRLLVAAEKRELIERPSFLSSTLAFSLAALGLTALLGSSGVLSVFVAGVTFDRVVQGKERAEEEAVVEAVDRLFTLPVFILLGLSVPWQEWLRLGWPGALLVLGILLLRLPAWLLLRPLTPRMRGWRDALFLGWFGPIGVATLYYATYAQRHTGRISTWVVGSLLICASGVAHGLSATPLTRRYGRSSRR